MVASSQSEAMKRRMFLDLSEQEQTDFLEKIRQDRLLSVSKIVTRAKTQRTSAMSAGARGAETKLLKSLEKLDKLLTTIDDQLRTYQSHRVLMGENISDGVQEIQ